MKPNKRSSGRRGCVQLLQNTFSALVIRLMVIIGLVPSLALANPAGGVVAQGAASIDTVPGTVTVNQSTNSAVINWQSFSINSGELTQFIVPNASSSTLNRVVGSNLSQINGTLQSNGQLFLINQNGIIFGSGGVVNAGGFVGSTLNLDDSQFMQGGALNFVGNSAASIQNLGTINASCGDVHLIAAHVQNDGAINAPNGTVGLAGGTSVLLQPAGQQKLFIQPTADAGSVVNTGTIVAVAAELRADSGNVYALAVNNSGTIRATGVVNQPGHVYLVSTGKGKTVSTGTILAKNVDGKGGFIETSGDYLGVSGTVLTGEGGSWLLDPTDVYIDSVGGGSNVTASTVLGQLAIGAANISTASGNVTVASALNWTSANALTLFASGKININAPITASAGGLLLNAGSTITDTAAINVASFNLIAGTWVQNTASLPTFSASNFVISGGSFLRVLGGNGTAGNPYQLTDVYGLAGVGSSFGLASARWVMANDIDASVTTGWVNGTNSGFSPISAAGFSFSGIFDGANHTISNLYINSNLNSVGLFGGNAGGTIQNLGVVNATVTNQGAGGKIGILAGSTNYGGVFNCYTSGTVTGLVNSSNSTGNYAYVGGLIGFQNGGSTYNSTSSAAVFGNSTASSTGQTGVNAGGLIGELNLSNLSNSYATGTVTVRATSTSSGATSAYGGGLVGYSFSGSSISNSYATGNVVLTATSSVSSIYGGGLEAYNNGSTISNSYATGNVIGNVSNSSGNYLGGLVAYNQNNSNVTFMGNITNSLALGNVSLGTGAGSNSVIGGFLAVSGSNTTVTSGYSTGSVAKFGLGNVTSNSFIATNTGTVITSGNISSAQLATQSTFSGWDFVSTWRMSPTAPLLKNLSVAVSGTVKLDGTPVATSLNLLTAGNAVISNTLSASNGTFSFLVPVDKVAVGGPATVTVASSNGTVSGTVASTTTPLDLTGLLLNGNSTVAGGGGGGGTTTGGGGGGTTTGGGKGGGLLGFGNVSLTSITQVSLSAEQQLAALPRTARNVVVEIITRVVVSIKNVLKVSIRNGANSFGVRVADSTHLNYVSDQKFSPTSGSPVLASTSVNVTDVASASVSDTRPKNEVPVSNALPFVNMSGSLTPPPVPVQRSLSISIDTQVEVALTQMIRETYTVDGPNGPQLVQQTSTVNARVSAIHHTAFEEIR